MEIYERDDWNARPPRFGYNTVPRHTTAVIHHSAGPVPKSVSHAKTLVRSYQWQHMFTSQLAPNGATDIAYHFLVDGEGNAYKGRPYGVQGAHARGGNDLMGICLLGDFSAVDPPRRALVTVYELCRDHGIRDTVPHSSVTPTGCPGDHGRLMVGILNAHLDRGWSPLGGPGWPPPHGRTLRLDWVSSTAAKGRAAGWDQCNNRLVSIARYPISWQPRSCAISWRGHVWRGRRDVINVAKHLVHKFGLKYR